MAIFLIKLLKINSFYFNISRITPNISSEPSPVKTTLFFLEIILHNSYKRTQPKCVVGASKLFIVGSSESANVDESQKPLYVQMDIIDLLPFCTESH